MQHALRHYAGVGGFIHFRDLAWCLQYRMYYMYSWLWQSKKINDPAEIIFGDKYDGIRSQFYREIGRKKRPAACFLCSNQRVLYFFSTEYSPPIVFGV